MGHIHVKTRKYFCCLIPSPIQPGEEAAEESVPQGPQAEGGRDLHDPQDSVHGTHSRHPLPATPPPAAHRICVMSHRSLTCHTAPCTVLCRTAPYCSARHLAGSHGTCWPVAGSHGTCRPVAGSHGTCRPVAGSHGTCWPVAGGQVQWRGIAAEEVRIEFI